MRTCRYPTTGTTGTKKEPYAGLRKLGRADGGIIPKLVLEKSTVYSNGQRKIQRGAE